MFHLAFKPGAYETLQEAYLWYELQLPGLGERLLEEMDGCFEKLRQTPFYYSYINESCRQMVLRNFPYKIIFEIIDRDVIIYAIFHTSRNSENII